MPKKFQGENTKAVVARARKENAKQAEVVKKEQAKEDAYWADEDKSLAKKQQRKEEKEKKKNEVVERKAASRKALEEEMDSIKAKPAQMKLSQAQIQTNVSAKKQVKKSGKDDVEEPIEENINRAVVDGAEARNIEEAISVLSVKEESFEKHPEKRMKAAYATFEAINLPRLKAENPNLRLSQLKQMLKKDWMKSPENPMNQQRSSYNS